MSAPVLAALVRIGVVALSTALLSLGGLAILACVMFVPDFKSGNEDKFLPWLALLPILILVTLVSGYNLDIALHGRPVGRLGLTANCIAGSVSILVAIVERSTASGSMVATGVAFFVVLNAAVIALRSRTGRNTTS